MDLNLVSKCIVKPATLIAPSNAMAVQQQQLQDHDYTANSTLFSPSTGKHSLDSHHFPPLKKTSIVPSEHSTDCNTLTAMNNDWSNSQETNPCHDENLYHSNSTDNLLFLTPNRRKNKSQTARPQQDNRYKTAINPLKNRYAGLSDSSMDEDVPPSPQDKIPPVFLHDANNHQALIQDLKSICKNKFFTEVKGKAIKINLSTSDDFRAITDHLDRLNQKYHSFCPPDKKRLMVIIRNIPISLSTDEVQNELKLLKYPVLQVARLYNKNKLPIPICSVTLEDTDNGAEIFGLEFICHSKVQVEAKRKPKSIPQCTRCQRFGHTKNYCKLDPRCVKCTGNHHFSECKQKSTEDVSCVNCGEHHAANYRGCPYFQSLKNRLNKNNGPTRKTATSAPFQPKPESFPPLNDVQSPSTSSCTQSQPLKFSNIVKNPRPEPSCNNNHSQNNPTLENALLSPLLSMVTSLVTQYLPQIKKFISDLLSSVLSNGN